MLARVKAKGHIVDVELSHYIGDVAWYITKCHASYSENELEFIDEPQDYWIRLEHQYAGMALQSLILMGAMKEEAVITASDIAQSLVENLKKEERE